MYSIYNDRKSVIAERFSRTWKNKIFKHMTAVSKNILFDVLDNIVNKQNNTVHKIMILMLIYNEDSNLTSPKFKVGDHVMISKYKNIFAKGQTQSQSKEVFLVNKIRDMVLCTYVISYLNGGKITGSFYEKQFQKINKKECRIEKVLKRKGDKLYVKWKGYDNSFNSWIDKKTLYINESVLS